MPWSDHDNMACDRKDAMPEDYTMKMEGKVQEETEMAVLQAELLRVVRESLQPETVFIWLNPMMEKR